MVDELIFEERNPIEPRVVPEDKTAEDHIPELKDYLRGLALAVDFEGDHAERFASQGRYQKAAEADRRQDIAIAREETAMKILRMLGYKVRWNDTEPEVAR